MSVLVFILLLLLFLINVPVAIALAMAATFVFILQGDVPLIAIMQRMFNAVDSFPLLAIPLFILAGKLMEHGGISKRLIRLADVIVGRIRGGLGLVSVLACTFFAAISGSAAATTAAVGSLLIPAMVKKGYDRNFATAIQAAGGTVGIMIPPSVPLILFGVAAGASISDLFIAGILPGIVVVASLMLLVYVISVMHGYGGGERYSFKDFVLAFKDASLGLMMPVIILGGIYGGIFTPTEAAVVAVVYGLIVGVVVYREIKWKDLIDIFNSTVIISSVIMFIIAGAAIFGYYLTREKIPAQITEFMLSLTDNWIVALLIINLLLLIIGVFLETAAAIIILTPILAPIATALGIDIVHFGIIMIVNLAIGFITPPVGINLFVAANIAGTKLESLLKAIIPFILTMVISLLIISYIPAISLFFLGR
ncbi:TRAP dicarboxylate transporter, DctM subunit [Caldalkalibacillus thermarum TA2.A1]|uniref:TRAP dicarboxylate transporter, DctM subunit n=1 Tax=Caldalkalibacillus thermarum (strain TA2.A1) TaxID=986075 RepID=F5LA26_CALTT|nr:TRAP transporter large permease subunit [Caldalkalibacillus thermarum]EGL81746.1 TRAP dicarboxylate transporter, DctM subunit [Caldalkalibacillus thermarum TA2.A1]QZT34126.1 TRAP transporter large permease [Caldalkalibacillus thermarum TA2.A1]